MLFVIAADESIKPQTREHFEICRLLRIPRGIVALTKADLVDPDILELVKLEAAEMMAGSFLEKAPVIPVSAFTGQGLDMLRSELAAIALSVPERASRRSFRIPVDRAVRHAGIRNGRHGHGGGRFRLGRVGSGTASGRQTASDPRYSGAWIGRESGERRAACGVEPDAEST